MVNVNALKPDGSYESKAVDLSKMDNFETWLKTWGFDGLNASELLMLYKEASFTDGENLSPKDFIAKIAEKDVPKTATEADALLAKAEELNETFGELESAIKQLEGKLTAEKAKASPQQTEIEKLEKQITELKHAKEAVQNKLKAILSNLEAGKSQLTKPADKTKLNTFVEKFAPELKSQQPDKGNGSVNWNEMGKAIFSGGGGEGAPAKGKAGGSPYGLSWGPAGKGFSAGAFAVSSMYDDFKLQAVDTMGEAQKRQRMMLLFFYYARMAMSGDVNAMYQFMRFVGQIIAKDKALQNVWMGTQLIKLQDASRKATQRLMEAKADDDSFEAQADFSKLMQSVKSEETMIATSQKLIAQMMEEFTQVVELVTNVQKSLLDVNGKLLSNLSVWR